MGIFVDLQLKCTDLAFQNRPFNTGDMIHKVEFWSTLETRGFVIGPSHDLTSQAYSENPRIRTYNFGSQPD